MFTGFRRNAAAIIATLFVVVTQMSLVCAQESTHADCSGDHAITTQGDHNRLPTKRHYVGVSSCSTTGCHGNTTAEKAEKHVWQSSYTVWSAEDAHSDAYTTLFGRRSRAIVERLCEKHQSHSNSNGNMTAQDDPLAYQQYVNDRCGICHATAWHQSGAATQHASISWLDGVSCESCHGAARHWLDQHDQEEWQNRSESEKEESGLINTRDLSVRAGICVRCHVGPSSSEPNRHGG